eukprot:1924013-Rhodomonas_salina.1
MEKMMAGGGDDDEEDDARKEQPGSHQSQQAGLAEHTNTRGRCGPAESICEPGRVVPAEKNQQKKEGAQSKKKKKSWKTR